MSLYSFIYDSMNYQIRKKALYDKLNPSHHNGSKHCSQCGYCCWIRPGSLTPEDVPKMAKFLGLTPKELFKKYLVVDYIDHILCLLPIRKSQEDLAGSFVPSNRTYDIDTPCIFHTETGCRIHECKPHQCETMKCWEDNDSEVALKYPRDQLLELGWDAKET